MARSKVRQKARVPVAHAVIEPNGVYRWQHLTDMLGLPLSAIRRAVRDEGLRRSRRGSCYVFLGEWVLEWLRKGEIKRRKAEDEAL